MPRARDLGIGIGTLPTGPTNSVLDVEGVGLGHTTLHPRDGAHRRHVAGPGRGRLPAPARRRRPPCSTGSASAPAWPRSASPGMLETPVWLTSTMQLGRVYDAACEIELARHPEVADDVVHPGRGGVRRLVPQRLPADVGDPRRRARGPRGGPGVARRRRRRRTRARSGPGPACRASGFKGGIGTSSRVTPGGHTVAVLLMTNFGERERLTVDGVPVGRLLAGWHVPVAGRSPPGPASASSSPTPRSTRRAASGSPVASVSGWRAPGRWPTTAAARSSWPRARPPAPTGTAPSSTPGRGWPAASSTSCSPPSSTPPRSRSSTRC